MSFEISCSVELSMIKVIALRPYFSITGPHRNKENSHFDLDFNLNQVHEGVKFQPIMNILPLVKYSSKWCRS